LAKFLPPKEPYKTKDWFIWPKKLIFSDVEFGERHQGSLGKRNQEDLLRNGLPSKKDWDWEEFNPFFIKKGWGGALS